MPAHKFNPGDFVRNVNPNSVHYARIKDKIGIFKRYWSICTVNEACDVDYGVDDGSGEPLILAQAVCDLQPVAGYQPLKYEPFNWTLGGRIVRIHSEMRYCGRKACPKCYPPSKKAYPSHGPYYVAYWHENGKRVKRYVGTTLPPLTPATHSEARRR